MQTIDRCNIMKKPLSMIDYYEPKLDLTLLGCGFLGPYHLGAICLLEQIWPKKPYNRICGASCGGLVGALLVSGLKLGHVLELALGLLRQLRLHFRRTYSPRRLTLLLAWRRGSAKEARRRRRHWQQQRLEASTRSSSEAKETYSAPAATLVEPENRTASLASFLPIGRLVQQTLERWLPVDAHIKCSGRLGLSVTRMSWSLENKFVSEFHSRQDLIQAVCAGCFIPIWSGSLRCTRFRNQHYMDGAYSDNEPKFQDSQRGHHIVASARDTVNHDHDCGDQSNNTRNSQRSGIIQVALSPFACDVEVSPKDRDRLVPFTWSVAGNVYKCTWPNVLRALHAMLPFRQDIYRQYLVSGYEQMKDYLFRKRMLKCEKCFMDCSFCQQQNEQRVCLYCLWLFERVDSLRLPDQVLKLFNENFI